MAEPTNPVDIKTLMESLGAGGGVDNASRLKLLELLMAQSKGDQGTRVGVTGDVLKMQGERAAALADSYAPGTKYHAGFEPEGVFDALSAFSKELGGRGFEIDPGVREVNAQHFEDMGSSIADAMTIMRQIVDADGEDNAVQTALMAALTDSLLPKDKAAAGGKPGTGDLSGRTGDLDMGVGGTAATPGPKQSIKPPLGAAGEPKGNSGGSTNILDGLSGLVESIGIPNPFAGIGPSMHGGAPNKSSAQAPAPAPMTDENFSPDATAAMVAQIMQRNKNVAPNAGPNKKKWGANKPGSNHPTGYQEGSQVFEGTSLIRVGERPAGDKKYAQEEVVLAAPGTVVAPVPKGLENPSEEDAAGLIIAQILKTQKAAKDTGMHDSRSGSLTSSATNGRNLAMQSGLALNNQRLSHKNQHLDRLQRDTQMRINERSTNRGLDLQGTQMNMNYDLGLKNWMLGHKQADQSYSLGNKKLALEGELGRGNLQLGRDQLNLNFQRNQEEFRNWEQERALKRELGMRGLDIDKQRADQDYQLNSAQMAFQQIMAGITGSALPGVRAGRTPQLGLLG